MKSYIVLTHLSEGGVHTAHRVFALKAEEHHEAVARVQQADGDLHVDTVLHLRDETADRLRLADDEVWEL